MAPRISRNMHNAAKQYVMTLWQEGVPLVDADENDRSRIGFELLREFIVSTGNAGLNETGFQIKHNDPPDNNNNFSINKGTAYPGGMPARMYDTVQYVNDGATIVKRSPYAISTGLGAYVLTDSRSKWIDAELVGRYLVPNIEDTSDGGSAKTFLITANTDTTITVDSGDGPMTDVAEVGDHYRINLQDAPAVLPDRYDHVWLNAYLRVVDSSEDPDLLHEFAGGKEAQLRYRLCTVIMVTSSDDANECDYDVTPYKPSGLTKYDPWWTDSDGEDHYMIKLAVIRRSAGSVGQILEIDITQSGSEWAAFVYKMALFCGSSDSFETMPVYTSHEVLTDGDSLVAALCKIDTAIGTLSGGFSLDLAQAALFCGSDPAHPFDLMPKVKTHYFLTDGLPLSHPINDSMLSVLDTSLKTVLDSLVGTQSDLDTLVSELKTVTISDGLVGEILTVGGVHGTLAVKLATASGLDFDIGGGLFVDADTPLSVNPGTGKLQFFYNSDYFVLSSGALSLKKDSIYLDDLADVIITGTPTVI